MISQAWWCMLEIQALWRLRQDDCEFKASLGYNLSPKTEKAYMVFDHANFCHTTNDVKVSILQFKI
jgi:hypothetical protein